jgi:hypothetical protein
MMGNSRRRFLKHGGTIVWLVPAVIAASRDAFAEKNQAMRTSMKYQDHPGPENKDCAGCMHFVPGKTPTALGGCKIYPGDTEISAKGYCIAWTKKA